MKEQSRSKIAPRTKTLLGAAILLWSVACADGEPEALAIAHSGDSFTLQPCEDVILNIEGYDASTLTWRLDGMPLMGLRYLEPGTWRFRAPTSNRFETLVLSAQSTDGREGSITFELDPSPSTSDLGPGMVQGCAPFPYGVASAESMETSIVLWTALDESTSVTELNWVISPRNDLATLAAEGTVTLPTDSDGTVSLNANGLMPDQVYFYQFETPDGELSPVGRFKTAPNFQSAKTSPAPEETPTYDFITTSCSSIYSGYFNGYRRMAERDALHMVLHLGDYIYDYADEDELIRMPGDPVNEAVPNSLETWRQRHKYYLSDPDLRFARSAHAWRVIWDNHDLAGDGIEDGSIQAFREWMPVPIVDANQPIEAYRSVTISGLADLILVDSNYYAKKDVLRESDAYSMLGLEQQDWLRDKLESSTTPWRIIGSQKLFGNISVNSTYVGGDREVFDDGAWDGYPEERALVFEWLSRTGDNLFLSGDSHISVAMNLVSDQLAPQLGEGIRAGVEVLPSSISRGNFDEQLQGDPLGIIEFVLEDTASRNPHHRYVELTEHGYGVFNLSLHQISAEFWYSPIYALSGDEVLGSRLISKRGDNQWSEVETFEVDTELHPLEDP